MYGVNCFCSVSLEEQDMNLCSFIGMPIRIWRNSDSNVNDVDVQLSISQVCSLSQPFDETNEDCPFLRMDNFFHVNDVIEAIKENKPLKMRVTLKMPPYISMYIDVHLDQRLTADHIIEMLVDYKTSKVNN